MNNYDLSAQNIVGMCYQIIRSQKLTNTQFDLSNNQGFMDGYSYETAIRELSHDGRWRNDVKLIAASTWYLAAIKLIPNFHFLHGDLFNFYINRWNHQVVLADTLGKICTSTHAATLKFRYNYTRHECIHGGSHFIRELNNQLKKHGSEILAGSSVGEPDRIPALRDQSIHFHMGLSLSKPHNKRQLDELISYAVDSMNACSGKVVHVGPTHTSELDTPEAVRGWELYAAKSAQELGFSSLSNVFEVTPTGLSAL